MKTLTKLRALGAQYAIPLQVLVILIALIEVFTVVPLLYFILHVLDEHNRLLHLGPLSWFAWILAGATVFCALLLWALTRLLDADLDSRR